MTIANTKLNLFKILAFASTITLCSHALAVLPAQPTANSPDDINGWDTAYNKDTKKRFIPVELFTGGQWDGKHKLIMKPENTIACSSFAGKPCNKYHITGPFKTA